MSRDEFWDEAYLYDLRSSLKMSNTNTVYSIVVKFKGQSGWSKEYTYLYPKEIPADSLVVIPNNDGFVSVARVKRSIKNYKMLPGITYKNIIEVLKTTAKDL